MQHNRILLKLSGEALCTEEYGGIEPDILASTAQQIAEVREQGIEVAVVVGGGNFWRYRDNTHSPIERSTSDHIGMLATVMNAAALQGALDNIGVPARVQSAVPAPKLAEMYVQRRALHHLQHGNIVICAGGTGNPYFTTDTAAALRAVELKCDVVLKATTVDGVYDRDPKEHSDARKYYKLTYQEAISKNLKVMDQTAFTLCQEEDLPICVFNFFEKGNLLKAAKGDDVGTIVQ